MKIVKIKKTDLRDGDIVLSQVVKGFRDNGEAFYQTNSFENDSFEFLVLRDIEITNENSKETISREKIKLDSCCEGTVVRTRESPFFIVQCNPGQFILLKLFCEYDLGYRMSANRQMNPMSLEELNRYLNQEDAHIIGKNLSVRFY